MQVEISGTTHRGGSFIERFPFEELAHRLQRKYRQRLRCAAYLVGDNGKTFLGRENILGGVEDNPDGRLIWWCEPYHKEAKQ